MSLKSMHESRQNNPEPVIFPEDLLKQTEEALKALKLEQARRIEVEQENDQLRNSLQEQTELLTQLCEQSENEMPTKLSEQLLNEQEKNRQLRQQLQNVEDTAADEKKAADRRISELEADISGLQRKLEYQKFDKKAYLNGLESREQALIAGQESLEIDRADFESRVQSKAREIVQDTISDYESRKARCEAEETRFKEQQRSAEAERQEWLSAEKEKIDTEVTRQVTEYKAELDEQTAQERAEHDRQYEDRKEELEIGYKSRNTALTAKYATISGITIIVGLISGIMSIFGSVIAFTHGLLPFIIADGTEIGNWIRNNWNAIFGQAFVFPTTLLPIMQLALPLIFLIVLGIWTAFNFDERKWVICVDTVSVIIIGAGTGISAVFGKQLSEMCGINTVMLPVGIYMGYTLIRFLIETGFVDAVIEKCGNLRDRAKNLTPRDFWWTIPVGTIIALYLLFR